MNSFIHKKNLTCEKILKTKCESIKYKDGLVIFS